MPRHKILDPTDLVVSLGSLNLIVLREISGPMSLRALACVFNSKPLVLIAGVPRKLDQEGVIAKYSADDKGYRALRLFCDNPELVRERSISPEMLASLYGGDPNSPRQRRTGVTR